MSRKKLCCLAMFGLVVMFLAAPVGAADLKSSIVAPPSYLLSGAESIGFANFDGPGGQALKEEMISLANESERQGQKDNPLAQAGLVGGAVGAVADVGKGLLSTVGGIFGGSKGAAALTGGNAPRMIEHGLSTNPFQVKSFANEDEAKAAGVSAIVKGTISGGQVNRRKYSVKTNKGNIPCVEMKTSVTATITILNPNGDTLTTKDASGAASKSACGAEINRLPNDQQLADMAVKPAAIGLADHFLPHTEVLKLNLANDKVTKNGEKLAKKNQYDEAIKDLQKALADNPKSYAAQESMGAMYEFYGYYDKALECYTQAENLAPKDKDKTEMHKSVNRVKSRIAQIGQLEKLGLKLKPRDLL
jgi:hypothetical protein